MEYTLSVLLEPGIAASLPIVYGQPPTSNHGPPTVYIVPSGFFDGVYGRQESLPQVPLSHIEGVPLLFGAPLVEKLRNALIVKADIVASAYFLLTRYEEWVRPQIRDEHGRFPGKESLPFRAGFIHRPIVDEYAALLRNWAAQVGVALPRPKRRFSVLLTHDVDSLGPEPGLVELARSAARGLLRQRPLRQVFRDALTASGLRRHPYDNLDDVARLDQRLTRRSPPDRCRPSYFFQSSGTSVHGADYRLGNRRTRDRLSGVLGSGADIGLHASYEAGSAPDRVAAERETLEKLSGVRIDKNRHHFLRWREPEHGAAIAAAGIVWDATLGYFDVAGFRLGVCHSVPLFDPTRCQPLAIEEHPLVVMDCTLDRSNYMNLGEDAAFDCVRALADATFRYQGELVCLWHNTVLASNDSGYHRRLYPRVLDYLGRLLDSVSDEDSSATTALSPACNS